MKALPPVPAPWQLSTRDVAMYGLIWGGKHLGIRLSAGAKGAERNRNSMKTEVCACAPRAHWRDHHVVAWREHEDAAGPRANGAGWYEPPAPLLGAPICNRNLDGDRILRRVKDTLHPAAPQPGDRGGGDREGGRAGEDVEHLGRRERKVDAGRDAAPRDLRHAGIPRPPRRRRGRQGHRGSGPSPRPGCRATPGRPRQGPSHTPQPAGRPRATPRRDRNVLRRLQHKGRRAPERVYCGRDTAEAGAIPNNDGAVISIETSPPVPMSKSSWRSSASTAQTKVVVLKGPPLWDAGVRGDPARAGDRDRHAATVRKGRDNQGHDPGSAQGPTCLEHMRAADRRKHGGDIQSATGRRPPWVRGAAHMDAHNIEASTWMMWREVARSEMNPTEPQRDCYLLPYFLHLPCAVQR